MRRTPYVLAAALLLAGCSSQPAGAPTTSDSAAAPGAAASTASAPASPTPTGKVTPGVFNGIGQGSEVIGDAKAARPASVSIPKLPLPPAYTSAMRDWAVAQTKAFASGKGDNIAGGWAYELQQWPLVGVRLQANTYTGALPVTRTVTYYTDGQATIKSVDLIDAKSKKAAADGVRSALGGKADGVSDDDALADLRFGPDGSLRALVSTGGDPRPGGGLAEASIPADKASGWLSASGKQFKDAYAAHWKGLGGAQGDPTPQTVNCEKEKCIALTFDDGPGVYSDYISDAFEAVGGKATFFELGRNDHPNVAQVNREGRLGQAVGTHTQDHAYLNKMPLAAQQKEVADGAAAIEAAGAPKPTLLRPPYGDTNADTNNLGYPIILWNDDSGDWESLNTQKAVDTGMKGASSGAVVLMHSIYPTSADAVPQLIKKLREQGYVLVTIPQLYQSVTPLKPGTTYFSRHNYKPNYVPKGSTTTTVMPTAGATAAPEGMGAAGGMGGVATQPVTTPTKK